MMPRPSAKRFAKSERRTKATPSCRARPAPPASHAARASASNSSRCSPERTGNRRPRARPTRVRSARRADEPAGTGDGRPRTVVGAARRDPPPWLRAARRRCRRAARWRRGPRGSGRSGGGPRDGRRAAPVRPRWAAKGRARPPHTSARVRPASGIGAVAWRTPASTGGGERNGTPSFPDCLSAAPAQRRPWDPSPPLPAASIPAVPGSSNRHDSASG